MAVGWCIGVGVGIVVVVVVVEVGIVVAGVDIVVGVVGSCCIVGQGRELGLGQGLDGRLELHFDGSLGRSSVGHIDLQHRNLDCHSCHSFLAVGYIVGAVGCIGVVGLAVVGLVGLLEGGLLKLGI